MFKVSLLAQLLELGKAALHGPLLTSSNIFGAASTGSIQSPLAVVSNHMAEGLFLDSFLALLC